MDKRLADIHPGEILSEDFLLPMGISPYRLAKETHIDQKRISDIIHGRRAISADTALRLGRFFRTSAQFWLNMQAHYDLEAREREMRSELKKIKPVRELANSK